MVGGGIGVFVGAGMGVLVGARVLVGMITVVGDGMLAGVLASVATGELLGGAVGAVVGMDTAVTVAAAGTSSSLTGVEVVADVLLAGWLLVVVGTAVFTSVAGMVGARSGCGVLLGGVIVVSPGSICSGWPTTAVTAKPAATSTA